MASVPSLSDLNASSDKIAALLKARGHSVAICEATSGGLITASLQGVSGASGFMKGSLLLYTRNEYRQLPKEIRKRIIVDYSDPNFGPQKYRKSKENFVIQMANYVREIYGATYGLAESGATEASRLGEKLQSSGAFTAVGIVGPSTTSTIVEFYDSPTNDKRRENMLRYGNYALETFHRALNLAHL